MRELRPRSAVVLSNRSVAIAVVCGVSHSADALQAAASRIAPRTEPVTTGVIAVRPSGGGRRLSQDC